MPNNSNKESIQSTLESATKQLGTCSESASLDAEVLLCHILKKPRSHFRAWPEKIILPEQHKQFLQFLDQRMKGVPIAYLTGNKEFWSREFRVTPDVLIPRPDTELLIERSLHLIENKANAKLIDLGTGSGIIAITLAAERPDIEVTATDTNDQALKVAKHNAKAHQINNLQFIQSNWFDKVSQNKFDLVISNPPYISPNDPHLLQGDVRFEPDCALIADDQGLKDIKNICQHARHYLNPNGTLLIEHGYDQQVAVQTIFDLYNYRSITTHNDLSGHPRVTTGLK